MTDTLKVVWAKLEPFRSDIAKIRLEKGSVAAVQFRGYNNKSLNSPRKGQMTLWINNSEVGESPSENKNLLRKHKALLKRVWTQLLNQVSSDIDRVMIVVEGSKVYVAGIYPAGIDAVSDNNLPIYQPSKDPDIAS